MKRLDVENLEGDVISYLIGENESFFFYLSPALKLRKLCLLYRCDHTPVFEKSVHARNTS